MAAQPALAVKEVVRFPGSVGPPTDPFEYRTGPPVDLSEYRWRRALLQVCVVTACPFWGWGAKRTRPPPYPPVPVVARAAEGGGGSNDAH